MGVRPESPSTSGTLLPLRVGKRSLLVAAVELGRTWCVRQRTPAIRPSVVGSSGRAAQCSVRMPAREVGRHHGTNVGTFCYDRERPDFGDEGREGDRASASGEDADRPHPAR